MKLLKTLFLSSTVSLLSLTAAHAIDCQRGRQIADAEVIPPRSLDTFRATQFAWDGGRRITFSCNLTTPNEHFEGVWPLYAREVNGEFSGICIQLSDTHSDRDLYSCVTPDEVARAANAPRGSRAFRLRFDDWHRGVPAGN